MNFGDLKTKVAAYLNRTDLTTEIPNFINLAQRDAERGQVILHDRLTIINWTCMKKRQTVSSDEAYITLPDNIKEVRWLKILLNGRYYPLDAVSPETALNLYHYPSDAEGRPVLFAFLDEQGELLVRPTPDQTYTYDMGFYAYSDELVNDSDTNWWTDNAWEVLLYGALAQAEPYLMNDPRIATWKGLYESALQKLAKAELSAKAALTPLRIRSYLPKKLQGGGSDFDFITGE